MAKSSKKKPAKKPLRRAKKPTKDETVEVHAGGTEGGVQLLIGNMPPVKDILYHLEQIAGYQAKAKTASMAVKKAKDTAKEAGVDLKALARTKELIGMDPMDMATFFRQLQVLMREKGMPVQMALFEPKFGSVDEQATKFGWDAGIAGRSPPVEMYPEGTPGHEAMMRAWNDAQRQIIEDGKSKKDE